MARKEKIKILVVDDSTTQREFLSEWLVGEGHEVFAASNGTQGLAKTFEVLPDIIISDIVMPQMNGQELVERLIPLQPQMKVLFISGYSEDVFSTRSTLDPGILYVQKPFTPVELLGKVRHVLDSE